MSVLAHAPVYDTLEQAKKFKGVGFAEDQAEVLALSIRDALIASRSDFATKADIAELRAAMYRALWILGPGLAAFFVTIFSAFLAALRFIPLG